MASNNSAGKNSDYGGDKGLFDEVRSYFDVVSITIEAGGSRWSGHSACRCGADAEESTRLIFGAVVLSLFDGLSETAMKRPARLLLAACVTTIIAAGASGYATAAEGVAMQQNLANVKTSNQVLSAAWMRQSDSYSLKVVLDRSAAAKAARKPWNPRQEAARANAAALVEEYRRPQTTPDGTDFGSFFIGNTIANLRGLDPVFDCRTLTLVDGRRVVSTQTASAPTQVSASIARAANIKNPQIDVWLLKADGTQIHPATSTCELGSKASLPREDVTISYGYSVADSAQAVAVAIRIDGDYYIDKLQPLAAPPTVQ